MKNEKVIEKGMETELFYGYTVILVFFYIRKSVLSVCP